MKQKVMDHFPGLQIYATVELLLLKNGPKKTEVGTPTFHYNFQTFEPSELSEFMGVRKAAFHHLTKKKNSIYSSTENGDERIKCNYALP